MTLNFLILLIGFGLLIEGANLLIDGAVALARRYGISHTIIGLTIVAAGTSAPEYAVSFIGALSGKSNIALGNIIGSNIFNIGAVLGIVGLISPMKIKTKEIMTDTIILNFIGLLFILLASNDMLGNIEGLIFILFFIGYIYLCYRRRRAPVEELLPEVPSFSMLKVFLFIIAGIIGLAAGGKLTVYSAEKIAKFLGVSDAVISLSVVALGTSLPEFITSVISVIKKQAKISIGNVVGSNIFNMLFCLGSAATARSLNFDFQEIKISLLVMFSFSIILVPFVIGNKINRYKAAILLLSYILYIWYIFSG